MNGTTCAVMVFYKDTFNGQNSTATPRWLGINQVGNALDNTIIALNTIVSNEGSAFPSTDDDQGLLADFTNTLSTSGSFSSSELTNPNPEISKADGKANITPLYITNYGSYTASGSTLNTIYQEFDTKLQGSYDLRSSAQSYVNTFQSNTAGITSKLQSVRDGIFNLQTPFNKFSDSVITTWIDVVKSHHINIINFSKSK